MKRIYTCAVVMALILLSACSRERITLEYAETDYEQGKEEWQDNDENNGNSISSDLKFMKNPFYELENEQENTIYQAYFETEDLADKRKEIWDGICSLPGVERVQTTTVYSGNLRINLKNIHPEYYKRTVNNGYDENLLNERGYLDIRVYVYTSPDIEKNTLSMFHRAKEESDWWDIEEWPLYVEENTDVELIYADASAGSITSTVTIESITEQLPWYLNYSWSNNEAVLLLKEEEYSKIYGEDRDGRNISNLFGFERYYVDCKQGCQEEIEKKMLEFGTAEVSRAGYLKVEK